MSTSFRQGTVALILLAVAVVCVVRDLAAQHTDAVDPKNASATPGPFPGQNTGTVDDAARPTGNFTW